MAIQLRVSLVVPLRNAAGDIDSFFTALNQQTFQDFQVLFSYGTSDDGTLEKLKEAMASHPNITSDYHDCGSLSLGEAKNYWLDQKEKETEYYCFLDIDDRPHPDFLTKLMSFVAQADLVQCGFSRIEEGTGKLISQDQIHNVPYAKDLFSDPSLIYIHTATWNKLFRRDLIGEDIRFPSGKKFEDLVFVISYLARCHNVVSINESLYDYLVAKESRSSMKDPSSLEKSNADVQTSLLLLKDFYKKNKPEAIDNGFLDALVFMRYGIGFTTRMCLSKQKKSHLIIRESKQFLDSEFPNWRKTSFLSWKKSHRFGRKTWFVRWCRRLYKVNCFSLFVLCYKIYTGVLHKDIKP